VIAFFPGLITLASMKSIESKTEELFCFLLWNAEMLMRPTFRNLTDSFESWMYREGFAQQLQRLERQKMLERSATQTGPPGHRLTEQGRLVALGGRDPEAAWNRPWDGKWRLVVFDVPETKNALRVRLRRFLKDHAFGYLQKSVWITPDPLGGLLRDWSRGHTVESLISFEACPGNGESNSAIVLGAWGFDYINCLYAKCRKILAELPDQPATTPKAAAELRRWARMEREAWLDAVAADPLLPSALLPTDYPGREVWQKRQRTLGRAARLVSWPSQ
jgi:DNA-binding transcriptional regulator PaaX